MKLRTKLIVAFMSVMILPMIFLNVVMHTFASREVGELQQLYTVSYTHLTLPTKLEV